MAEVLGLSDISRKDLEHEKLRPDFIKIYRNLSLKKSRTDNYYILITRYLQSPFRDFASDLRFLTGLNVDDNQFLLKQ